MFEHPFLSFPLFGVARFTNQIQDRKRLSIYTEKYMCKNIRVEPNFLIVKFNRTCIHIPFK